MQGKHGYQKPIYSWQRLSVGVCICVCGGVGIVCACVLGVAAEQHLGQWADRSQFPGWWWTKVYAPVMPGKRQGLMIVRKRWLLEDDAVASQRFARASIPVTRWRGKFAGYRRLWRRATRLDIAVLEGGEPTPAVGVSACRQRVVCILSPRHSTRPDVIPWAYAIVATLTRLSWTPRAQ